MQRNPNSQDAVPVLHSKQVRVSEILIENTQISLR